jgi:hypothetical protein
MTGKKDRFRRTPGAVATRARLGDEANSYLGKDILDWQRVWVQWAVCRLLAINVGSLAVIVGLCLRLLARNVSRKCPLFAGPGATVCRPLQLGSSDERWTADLRRGLFGLGQILSSMGRGLKEVHQGCAHEMPSVLSWLSTGSVLSTC